MVAEMSETIDVSWSLYLIAKTCGILCKQDDVKNKIAMTGIF